MGGAGKRKVVKFCLVVGLFLLAWNSLKVLRAARLGSEEGDLERGRLLQPLNAAHSQALARRALVAGEATRAARLAEDAIRVFPFRGSAWLDLAEARLKQGDKDGVREAVRKAAMLGPTKGKWRWRAALMLLEAGWTDDAMGELAAVARVDASRRYSAYDLAWTVFDDPDLVLARVVPGDAPGKVDYLNYLLRSRRAEAALRLWPAAKQEASLRLRYSYIDLMLTNGAVDEAWAAWAEAFPEARVGEIYNGEFTREIAGHGFGWRLGEVKGARVRLVGRAGEARALEVDFEGGNPTYDHSHQVVRVAGAAKYRLAARVRWEQVTSASHPHLYVQGYRHCQGLAAETMGFHGSGEATVTVEFVTPPGCKAIVVGLRRLSTRKLDRNIRGKIWLSQVELQQDAVAGRRPPAQASRHRECRSREHVRWGRTPS